MKQIIKMKFIILSLLGMISLQAFAQQRTLSGTIVSSEDHEPLIGATIAVKGAETRGTVTDVEGKYTLKIEAGDKILIVSYLGMKTQHLKVPASNKLDIILQPEHMGLDEVVVTGYGNFTKSSFTGSANTLKGDLMKNIPVVSVEQKLQGLTTGVSITGNSGQPGANQNIRIRGMGSFNASQEPLFVIDGVPVSSGSLSTGGADAAYMNNSKTNIMSTLNPSDIENITIIKDAAAASLYGSRAANGVILITTKRGQIGKARINFNASAGFSNAAVHFRPTLNGDQLHELLYEGLINAGIDRKEVDPKEFADSKIGEYSTKPSMGYTDWRDELLRTAVQQNYEASVSGGNQKSTYYLSLGYTNQEGLAKNSSLERYSARLNLTQKVGKIAEVGANMMFSQMNQEMNEERGSSINPFLCVAGTLNPSMTVRDENGNYIGTYADNTMNPLRDILTDYNRTRMSRMFATGYASIEPIKGLKIKETLSYDYNIQKDSRYLNALSSSGIKTSNGAQTAKGFIEYGKLISSTSINYVATFGERHNLDILAAYEIEDYKMDKAIGEKSKLPSDQLTAPDNAAVLNNFVSSPQGYRMLSYVSRLNYNYDSRYYLAGSFRRDGSSRLSPDNRWGNFWSVSAMWHLSNEHFMKPIKNVLSDLKIRASYGVNGNQPGAYYGYMGLYTYTQNYMGQSGSFGSSMPNNRLGWEKNYNLNIGLDLAFLNRIFLSLEYYKRDTKDLLYNRPISATTGFVNYLANVGQLNNKGVEFELRTLNFATSNFNWTTVINLSHNKNKIVSLNNDLEQSIEGNWKIHKIGLPYHTFYVKEFAGVNPENGLAEYYMNTPLGNGETDRTLTTDAKKATSIAYKSVDPKVSGGFTNLLSYRWFDLNFTFTYSLGGHSFDKMGTLLENGGEKIYSSHYNLPAYMMDRWQKPGDRTNIPRFSYADKGTVTNSSRYIHSTDHLRLKNLTFGFTLPSEWTSKVKIENARIYFSGSNLLTWAKWKQYDPEVPVHGEVWCEAPAMRTFSFGAQLTF